MKVVLLVADSLRADAPGYAGGKARTPLLDRLAAGGTTYEDCFASGTWTIPSILSLLTGRFGHRLGVARWRHPFPEGQPTLPAAFAAAGFEVASLHPHPRWGFRNVPGHGEIGDSQDPAAVERALTGRRGADRFVLIHHWWTHLPYLTRRLPLRTWHLACDFALESLGRHPRQIAPTLEASYLRAVEHLSEQLLGRYLDAAASGGDEVLLVVTGDHGETWGASLPEGQRVRNVYDLHGRWISDETIRVPLLLHGRTAAGAIPAGQRLGGLSRGVDVAPTIAELAGVPWPAPPPPVGAPWTMPCLPCHGLEVADGVSLAAGLRAGTSAPATTAMTVSSHNTFEPRTYPATGPALWRSLGLRTPQHWFVWDGVTASRTVRVLAGSGPPAAAEVDERIGRLETERLASAGPGPLIDPAEFPASSEAAVEDRLRTLGYLD